MLNSSRPNICETAYDRDVRGIEINNLSVALEADSLVSLSVLHFID